MRNALILGLPLHPEVNYCIIEPFLFLKVLAINCGDPDKALFSSCLLLKL